jgi:D-alanyl-D-alanine carboxypeptidase
MTRAAASVVLALLLATPAAARAGFAQDAQRLVDATVTSSPTAPGVLAHVEAPRRSLTLAGGSVELPRDVPLPTTAVFRYASNTKTYVAAAIVPRARAITVDMLLHHTSGLYDYASDPDYQAVVLANPARR